MIVINLTALAFWFGIVLLVLMATTIEGDVELPDIMLAGVGAAFLALVTWIAARAYVK